MCAQTRGSTGSIRSRLVDRAMQALSAFFVPHHSASVCSLSRSHLVSPSNRILSYLQPKWWSRYSEKRQAEKRRDAACRAQLKLRAGQRRELSRCTTRTRLHLHRHALHRTAPNDHPECRATVSSSGIFFTWFVPCLVPTGCVLGLVPRGIRGQRLLRAFIRISSWIFFPFPLLFLENGKLPIVAMPIHDYRPGLLRPGLRSTEYVCRP